MSQTSGAKGRVRCRDRKKSPRASVGHGLPVERGVGVDTDARALLETEVLKTRGYLGDAVEDFVV